MYLSKPLMIFSTHFLNWLFLYWVSADHHHLPASSVDIMRGVLQPHKHQFNFLNF